jgi:hypothetical protein
VRILLAGLGMTVAVWEFQNYFLGIAIFSGMVTYPILIFLLRVLPKEDIALLGQLVLQLQNKWRRPQTSSLHG